MKAYMHKGKQQQQQNIKMHTTCIYSCIHSSVHCIFNSSYHLVLCLKKSVDCNPLDYFQSKRKIYGCTYAFKHHPPARRERERERERGTGLKPKRINNITDVLFGGVLPLGTEHRYLRFALRISQLFSVPFLLPSLSHRRHACSCSCVYDDDIGYVCFCKCVKFFHNFHNQHMLRCIYKNQIRNSVDLQALNIVLLLYCLL